MGTKELVSRYNEETGFISSEELEALLGASGGGGDINPASTPVTPSSWVCVTGIASFISALTSMDSCPTGAMTKAC